MTLRPIVCPKGNQFDRIQKVSSTYGENTISTAYGGRVASTVLAEKLAPPAEPPLPMQPSPSVMPLPSSPERPDLWWYIAPIVPFGPIIMLGAPMSRIAKLVMLLCLVGSPIVFTFINSPAIQTNRVLAIFIAIIGLLLLVGYFVTCWVGIRQEHKRQKIRFQQLVNLYSRQQETAYSRWKQQMERFQLVDLLIWEGKKQKWNELYYCYTHESVFDPNTGMSVSPEEMYKLLQ